jgi:hypothetical protein
MVSLSVDAGAGHVGDLQERAVRGRREVDRALVTDPVPQKQGARTTCHSHMKCRTNELGALAGFEKSGHFFFNNPMGRGYDDGPISAIAVCEMLDRASGKSMADLKGAMPKTRSSPIVSPHCADETKYGAIDAVVKHFEAMQKNGEKVAGQNIRYLVNGVRVTVEDGSWGPMRASSNKPELVVVEAEQRIHDMFEADECGAERPSRSRRMKSEDLSAPVLQAVNRFGAPRHQSQINFCRFLNWSERSAKGRSVAGIAASIRPTAFAPSCASSSPLNR